MSALAIMLLWKNAPLLVSLPSKAKACSLCARLEDGMGLATLNVWIHDEFDPCRINDAFWFVTVTYCNGKVVEWCGQTYQGEDAKCGHADITLPPGCYIVYAFQWSPLIGQHNFTQHAIVVVSCDQTACVHLYTPTIWWWFFGARSAARSLAESGKLSPGKVERFVAAGDDLLKDIPQTAGDTAREGLVAHLAEVFKKNPPK